MTPPLSTLTSIQAFINSTLIYIVQSATIYCLFMKFLELRGSTKPFRKFLDRTISYILLLMYNFFLGFEAFYLNRINHLFLAHFFLFQVCRGFFSRALLLSLLTLCLNTPTFFGLRMFILSQAFFSIFLESFILFVLSPTIKSLIRNFSLVLLLSTLLSSADFFLLKKMRIGFHEGIFILFATSFYNLLVSCLSGFKLIDSKIQSLFLDLFGKVPYSHLLI